jgi:hypothetical protein
MRRYLYRRLAHKIRQPRPRDTVFVVVRLRDGAWWAGPYRWRGETFTKNKRLAYLWGRREAAQVAASWNGWTGVEIVEVARLEFRPLRKRRI